MFPIMIGIIICGGRALLFCFVRLMFGFGFGFVSPGVNAIVSSKAALISGPFHGQK